MKKLCIFAILLLYALISVSQEETNKFSYRHMRGNIGQNELVFDLVIKGNEVNGRAIFTSGTESGNENQLTGNIDEYSIAELESYRADELTGSYSGALKEYFNGYYRPANSQYGKNFELEDDYTQSIRFSGYSYSTDSTLTDSVGSPRAAMDISVLLPENADSNKYIREAVFETFFGNNNLSDIPDDSVLETYSHIYFGKYIEANIDIYDGGHAFNWETTANASIILNHNSILCYRADTYAYTGGAHGMGASRFMVFDTRNKTQIGLDDIFIESFENELSMLLEKKYRDMRFMEDHESLTDAGLFDNRIHPTENFLITDSEISFSYNPYELAPYAMGSITISLRKEEIIDLLKPDAAVKRLGW